MANFARKGRVPPVNEDFQDGYADEPSEIEWDKVFSEIEASFASNTAACDALEILVGHGCNRAYVLRSLYLFCGLYPNELGALRKELRVHKKKVTKTVKMVRTLASGIDEMAEWLAEADCYCHFAPAPENLRSYANFLRRMWVVLPPTKRLSGRDHHIVKLVEHVESRTSEKLWRQITDLVDAVSALYNPEGLTKEAFYQGIGTRQSGDSGKSEPKDRSVRHTAV